MPGAILLIEDLDSIGLGSGALSCVPYSRYFSPSRLSNISCPALLIIPASSFIPTPVVSDVSDHVSMISMCCSSLCGEGVMGPAVILSSSEFMYVILAFAKSCVLAITLVLWA